MYVLEEQKFILRFDEIVIFTIARKEGRKLDNFFNTLKLKILMACFSSITHVILNMDEWTV